MRGGKRTFTASSFTLIELLIVVAVVSILAAIAVPNFLEAQIRAKVATAKSDLRLLGSGLEAYHVDYSVYPPGPIPFFSSQPTETWRLTTPVAYLVNVPRDIFAPLPGDPSLGGSFGIGGPFLHYLHDPLLGEHWLAFSFGPDRDLEATEVHYDPSNGTVSEGDIFRTGGSL